MFRIECRREPYRKRNTEYSSAASVVFVALFSPFPGRSSSSARLGLCIALAQCLTFACLKPSTTAIETELSWKDVLCLSEVMKCLRSWKVFEAAPSLRLGSN